MPIGVLPEGQIIIAAGQGDVVARGTVLTNGFGAVGFEEVEAGEIGRQVKPDKLIAECPVILTFSSVESMDVVIDVLAQMRARMTEDANAETKPQVSIPQNLVTGSERDQDDR